MTKKQLRLSVFIIVSIVFLSFYAMNSFKTISLAHDLLTDIYFDKVNSGFVVDTANETIRDLDEGELNTFLSTIKTIDLKQISAHSALTTNDYIVSVSGSGGAFTLYLSNDGSMFIDGKLEEIYQVEDKQMIDTLLHVITY